MKKSNFITAFALALMACSIASASIMDISVDDSKLRKGSIIEVYNSSFNVTSEENFYVQNGDFITRYRIIFLENLNKLTSIKKHVSSLEQSLASEQNTSSQIEDMIDYKRKDNIHLAARLDSLKMETSILNNQSELGMASLKEFASEKAELESRVIGNFLVSPSQTTGLLVVFTILIAAVIAIEFRAYFSAGKTESKAETKTGKDEKK